MAAENCINCLKNKISALLIRYRVLKGMAALTEEQVLAEVGMLNPKQYKNLLLDKDGWLEQFACPTHAPGSHAH